MAKTVYLAGKITGDYDYKRKFEVAAAELEARGYIVVNPATLPSEGFEYGAYMRMSKAMLMECDAIYLLNDWMDSRGAQTEARVAARMGKEIIYEEDAQNG